MLAKYFDIYQDTLATTARTIRGYLTPEQAIMECMTYCSNARSNLKVNEEEVDQKKISVQAYKEQTSQYISEYLDTKQPAVAVVEGNTSRSLSTSELKSILERELNEYGILTQGLLEDPEVDEIVINSAKDLFVQKHGRYEPYIDKNTGKRFTFSSSDSATVAINRCLSFGKVSIKDSANGSVATATTPEGFRIQAVGIYAVVDEHGSNKMLFQKAPFCVIRKHGDEPLPMERLIEYESVPDRMARMFQIFGKYHLNVGVFGDLGSGKTTLLQSMVNSLEDNLRFAILEKASEIRARHFNSDGFMTNQVIQMEYQDFPEGNAPLYGNSLENLMAACLRLSIQEAIFGEVLKDSEFAQIKQAMSTLGVMFTGHATSVKDACYKFTDACLAAAPGQTRESVMAAVCQAIDIIIISSNMRNGSRKVTSVGEVVGIKSVDGVIIPDVRILFEYKLLGRDAETNNLYGYHVQRNTVSKELFKKITRTGADFEDIDFLKDKSYITSESEDDEENESNAIKLTYNGKHSEYETRPFSKPASISEEALNFDFNDTDIFDSIVSSIEEAATNETVDS